MSSYSNSSMRQVVAPPERCLAAAMLGDPVAISRLLRQAMPQARKEISAILGPSHRDTDDVLQEAMLGLAKALPSFRGDCKLSSFASRIAARAAISARRKRHMKNEYDE